ncbi:MAG: PAS domain-containing protein, partial [Dehalococcoidia bacterium]
MSHEPDKGSSKTSDEHDRALFNDRAAGTLEAQIRQQAVIIENADLGVAVYRLEDPKDPKSLRILSLNAVGERIMGARAKDVVGKLVLEAFPAADIGVLERDARVALGGAPEHVEETRYRGDARLPEAYFTVDDVPLGNLTMAILFRDVTERKRVEAELEGLARFPSENPNPVLRLSGKGKVLYANEAGRPFLNSRGDGRSNTAPKFLRALAEEALATQSSATVDVERGGRVWSMFVTPI